MLKVVVVCILISAVTGAPVFTTPDPDDTQDAHKIRMSELLKGEDTVITLAATDPDNAGSSFNFTMSDSPAETTDLFEIAGDVLKVKAGVSEGTFDFETATTSYTIELKVSDGTNTVQLSTEILIEDENDNKPEFSETPPYMKDIEDTVTEGTVVFTVTATDKDKTEKNNKIRYGIIDSAEFVINADTGAISVASGVTFDVETTSSYQLTITATDTGDPPQANAVTLTLNVVSVPMFDNIELNQVENVNENVAADTAVFTVEVSDKDTESGSLDVSIKSQSPNDTDMFKLDGNILKTSNNLLDADSQQTYTVIFEVTDGNHTTVSDPLTVTVVDLNDNPPVITTPAPTVNIPENQALGSNNAIADIDATDADVSAPNNVLSYSITSGNSNGIFGIITTTGVIYVVQTPKSMSVSQHILQVTVSDGGSQSQTATVAVTVNFNPNTVNECSGNPCQNGGVCTSFVNDYDCACRPGFSGDNCEININDCTATTCKNGGTCVDGINTFTCNCAAGYIGDTCIDACANNKYGTGCTQACNCNPSRLVENVGTQTCNHVTGACKCNLNWFGIACEIDVDECANSQICSAVPNKICINTQGGYTCICKAGYTENADNTCRRIPTPTLQAGANEFRVDVQMVLDKTCVNRDNPTVFEREKTALEAMEVAKLRSLKRNLVTDIRCGSEIFDSVVIIDNTVAAKTTLAVDLQAIRDGDTLVVDGVNTKVMSMTVNGKPLPATTSGDLGSKVCDVYTSYVTCSENEVCTYSDGVASCSVEKSENTDLILGITLGVCLPLLLGVIIGIVVCYYKNKRLRDDRDSYLRRRKSYDYPRRYDSDELPDKRDFYGLSPVNNMNSRY